MDYKLQYDSFQKFLVSAGVILIVAPFFILHSILSGAYDLIISNEDYGNLTQDAQGLLTQRVAYLQKTYAYGPKICFGFMAAGIVLLLIGIIWWFCMQRVLDETIKIDRDRKKHEYKQMTASEILEKYEEKTQSVSNADTAGDNRHSETKQTENAMSDIKGYMEITEAVYYYLKKKLGVGYRVHHDVKHMLGHDRAVSYDILARAVDLRKEIIYEVSYWERIPNDNAINGIIKKVDAMRSATDAYCKREVILVVVIKDKSLRDDVENKLELAGLDMSQYMILNTAKLGIA